METHVSPSVDENTGLTTLGLRHGLISDDPSGANILNQRNAVGQSVVQPSPLAFEILSNPHPPSPSNHSNPPPESLVETDLQGMRDEFNQHRSQNARRQSSIAFSNSPGSLLNYDENVGPPTPAKPSVIQRPRPLRQVTSQSTVSSVVDTRYVNMLLANEKISPVYDIFAFLSTWLVLAGFIVLPGTFENLGLMIDSNVKDEDQKIALQLLLKHVPLSGIAVAMSGLGLIGMVSLWWRWWRNYIWIVRKVFLPGCFNGIAGVVSVLVNIYAINRGHWPRFSLIALIVASSISGVCLALAIFHELILLKRIQREHKKQVGKHGTGRRGEGVLKALPSGDI